MPYGWPNNASDRGPPEIQPTPVRHTARAMVEGTSAGRVARATLPRMTGSLPGVADYAEDVIIVREMADAVAPYVNDPDRCFAVMRDAAGEVDFTHAELTELLHAALYLIATYRPPF